MRARVRAAARLVALAAACAPPAAGTVAPAAAPPGGGRALFELRNELWYNLDNFLYHAARARRRLPNEYSWADSAARGDTAGYGALAPEEREGWERALAHYVAERAGRPIDFDSGLVATSFALSGRGEAPLAPGEGLSPALVRALEDAAPAYRRLWWPRHRAANEAHAARLAPLLARHGDALARGLARAYRAPWPSAPPIVQLTPYANWAGAYTLLDPTLITVSSLYRGSRGTLGLELLFHEQSHAMMDSVSAALDRAGLPRGSRAAREVEHWIIFYTAGEVTRRAVPGHTTFAEWRGLWQLRGFDRVRRLLDASWKPYLDGRAPFGEALAELVRAYGAAVR